ncbi:MAG: transglycosylase domain-containing protein [Phycisphaerae bacterium]
MGGFRPWWQHRSRYVRWGMMLLSIPLAAWVATWLVPYHPPGPPQPTATWYTDRQGQPLAAVLGPQEQWCQPLTSAQIPRHVKQALVAAEDHRFYDHSGIDVWSAFGALYANVTTGGIRRGGSTITMQLYRLRHPEMRSWVYKGTQVFRAIQMERQDDKDTLLVEYLNRAPFGANLTGIEAAARRYFDISTQQLSLAQAALLAGLPQNPERLRPDRNLIPAQARRDRILQRMADLDYITTKQLTEALAEPIVIQDATLPQIRHPDGSLPSLLAHQATGVLRTTLDTRIQRLVNSKLQTQLETLHDDTLAGAVVVLDQQTSEYLALCSQSSTASALDLTQTQRSTGSTLKPFIYALAFERELISPTSILDDNPAAWIGFAPRNADRTFTGRVTAAHALAYSRNLPAMLVLSKVGVPSVVGLMDELHAPIAPAEQLGLTLAIGGAELSPRQIANAYACLARDGEYRPAQWLQGETSNPQTNHRVLLAQACQQTLAALRIPERTQAMCPSAVRHDPAWKTGTSNGYRDGWCVAVTPRYTVVVWLGRIRGRGDQRLQGSDVAAPLALDIIANLGPVLPWPNTPVPSTPEAPKELLLHRPLAIISPSAHQTICLDPDQPAARQNIVVTSAGGQGTRRFWFVDDQLQPQANGATMSLALTAGVRFIRVVDESGTAATLALHIQQ